MLRARCGVYLTQSATLTPRFLFCVNAMLMFAFSYWAVQTHADVSNVPMKITREREACLLGSAVLAAVGGGLFPDIPSAAQAMVHVIGTVVSQRGPPQGVLYHRGTNMIC